MHLYLSASNNGVRGGWEQQWPGGRRCGGLGAMPGLMLMRGVMASVMSEEVRKGEAVESLASETRNHARPSANEGGVARRHRRNLCEQQTHHP